MSRLARFLAELKRRRVYHVGVVYAAAAFVAAQAADIFLPRLGLPDWTVTAVVVLAVAGFPVALLLGWAFDITPTGVQRTDVAAHDAPPPGTWRVAGATAIATLVLVGGGWWLSSLAFRPSPQITSLAVVPFANLTGSPEQQHLVDAIHDAVIAELAQIHALAVMSRQSVLRYRDTDKSIPEIARELGVGALVEGSVFRAGDSVRVTVQLLQARPTERHLWAGTFQRDLRDILTLQGEVARRVSQQLRITVTPDELQRLARIRSVDPAAYEAWLRGWIERNRTTGPAVERCIERAREAVGIDPAYGAAYSLAADCHLLSHWTGATPAPPWEAFPQAKAAAQQAIAVDESMGPAHAILGFALGAFDWEWAAADRAFQRALELSPGDAWIHALYSYFLNWTARHDEAIEHARRAERLSPGTPLERTFLTAALLWARRFDEALAHGRRTVELFPDYGFGHEWLSWAYHLTGMYQESLAAQQEAVRLMGDSDINRKALLGRAYARAGRRSDALAIRDQLLQLQSTTYVQPVLFTHLHVGLDQTDLAIDWLERGFEDRVAAMAFLNTFPAFDPLRSDARFQQLVRRMNFPD